MRTGRRSPRAPRERTKGRSWPYALNPSTSPRPRSNASRCCWHSGASRRPACVSASARGCSGMSYTLEYADEKTPFDEVVETDGVTILIDPKATMFILGTEMDYVEDKLESGFVFRNPNEKGRCGCGESFHV